MIQTITHNGNTYPAFQSEGNAMQFAKAYAQKVCTGYGLDIGCNRHQWLYEDANGTKAIPVDPLINEEYDAFNLPPSHFDYIVSSHCLEHLDNWVNAVDYWKNKLKKNGVLFLYLPDYSQSYWRCWSNRKHVHTFTPQIIKDYLTDRGWQNVFVSGVDLNNSFMAMAQNG